MHAGYIDYSNSYPFLREALQKPIEQITLEAHPPGVLNQMLYEGQLHVSAISAFEYMQHSNLYWLLPELCINSFGYVKSVLLFSQKPFDELNDHNIYVTPESATSTHLLRILLNAKGVDSYTMLPFDKKESTQNKTAILLIGDGALQFNTQDHPHVYDLAHEWSSLTQLPVVFALWAVRQDYPSSYRPLLKSYLKQHLNAIKILNENMSMIAQEASERYPKLQLDFIDYYQRLDYRLNPNCMKSLSLYAEKLLDLGHLQTKPTFQFIDI